MLLIGHILARWDHSAFNERSLIVDDTVLPKTGRHMELGSHHFDHKTNRTPLGSQLLPLGYHNGRSFFPVNAGFHTSKKSPKEKLADVDKRSHGWKRRQESFTKKTELLEQMLHRAQRSGISARFVMFDSWFAHDRLIATILEIGDGVLCRLKANKTRYTYQGSTLTLKELWHTVARHHLSKVRGWNIWATTLDAHLPKTGKVRLVFVRWTKKRWHCFLCTETDLDAAQILDYDSRGWVIEVYFKDCKQLWDLGRGQSESFDALVALTTMVMIRYLLLVSILLKTNKPTEVSPLFRELAREQLHLDVLSRAWSRVRQALLMSSEVFLAELDVKMFLHFLDFFESALLQDATTACATL